MKPLTLEEQMQMLLDVNHLKAQTEALLEIQERLLAMIKSVSDAQVAHHELLKELSNAHLVLRSQVNAINGDFA